MKLIKTKPKYRCEFCRHTGIKKTMEIHEKRCWKNPKRYCDYCENKETITENYSDIPGARPITQPCPFCSKRIKDEEIGSFNNL